jgi:hypothetical protein
MRGAARRTPPCRPRRHRRRPYVPAYTAHEGGPRRRAPRGFRSRSIAGRLEGGTGPRQHGMDFEVAWPRTGRSRRTACPVAAFGRSHHDCRRAERPSQRSARFTTFTSALSALPVALAPTYFLGNESLRLSKIARPSDGEAFLRQYGDGSCRTWLRPRKDAGSAFAAAQIRRRRAQAPRRAMIGRSVAGDRRTLVIRDRRRGPLNTLVSQRAPSHSASAEGLPSVSFMSRFEGEQPDRRCLRRRRSRRYGRTCGGEPAAREIPK